MWTWLGFSCTYFITKTGNTERYKLSWGAVLHAAYSIKTCIWNIYILNPSYSSLPRVKMNILQFLRWHLQLNRQHEPILLSGLISRTQVFLLSYTGNDTSLCPSSWQGSEKDHTAVKYPSELYSLFPSCSPTQLYQRNNFKGLSCGHIPPVSYIKSCCFLFLVTNRTR